MKKNYNLACRLSAALLMASATIRFLADCFQNVWLKHHVSGKAGEIAFVKDPHGSDRVYVTYTDQEQNGAIVRENCTDLFLCLTWIDIIRKVMVVLSGLSMISYIANRVMQHFLKED